MNMFLESLYIKNAAKKRLKAYVTELKNRGFDIEYREDNSNTPVIYFGYDIMGTNVLKELYDLYFSVIKQNKGNIYLLPNKTTSTLPPLLLTTQ